MKKGVILLVIMVLLLVSCQQVSIVGKYNPEGYELPEALMEFTEDEMIVLGTAIPYSIKGDQIILEGEEGKEYVNFEVDGNKLILTAGNETQTFIKQEE